MKTIQDRYNRFALWVSLMALAVTMAGCAQLTKGSFNAKALAAQSSVTQLQITAKTLLDAKKISSADAENVNRTADVATSGIAVARQYAAADPKAGDTKLTAVIAILTAAQAALATQGAK